MKEGKAKRYPQAHNQKQADPGGQAPGEGAIGKGASGV